MRRVLRHVRRHRHLPQLRDKRRVVVAFVSAERDPRARQGLGHEQRRIALTEAIGRQNAGVHDQAERFLTDDNGNRVCAAAYINKLSR